MGIQGIYYEPYRKKNHEHHYYLGLHSTNWCVTATLTWVSPPLLLLLWSCVRRLPLGPCWSGWGPSCAGMVADLHVHLDHWWWPSSAMQPWPAGRGCSLVAVKAGAGLLGCPKHTTPPKRIWWRVYMGEGVYLSNTYIWWHLFPCFDNTNIQKTSVTLHLHACLKHMSPSCLLREGKYNTKFAWFLPLCLE